MKAITVSELNSYMAYKLKLDGQLQSVSISGEISNFINHQKSGHFYFTLKDSSSSLKCVMFRGDTLGLTFMPENGLQAVINGNIQVFERDGTYQLYAKSIERQGTGDLYAQFEKLKQKLEKGGYFSRKRPICQTPSKICVITAKTGAALRDMLTVMERRYPFTEVTLISALVQGKDAPESLVAAFGAAQDSGADTIIFGRGGGSAEDLWAFNDERVAMAVFNSKIPTISAVGHETDFTICDFTADLRAPTPSAAAELAVPDINEVYRQLNEFEAGLKKYIENYFSSANEKLNNIVNEISAKSPLGRLKSEQNKLTLIEQQLKTQIKSTYLRKEQALAGISKIISALSPINVLTRGYAIALDSHGKTIKNAGLIKAGDILKIKLHSGELSVNVIESIKES